MKIRQKMSPGKLVVAGAAAVALLVAVASPAAADNLPNDTAISGELTGGSIVVGSTTFSLGDDPTDPCGTNDPATISATVGAEVSDVAAVTDIETTFDSGEAISGVCAQLSVTNAPEGTQTQTGNGTGTIVIDDPGPDILVSLDNGCAINPAPVALSGTVDGTGPWDIELGASGFTVPAVASGGACSSFEAFAINVGLGLPTSSTSVTLEYSVS